MANGSALGRLSDNLQVKYRLPRQALINQLPYFTAVIKSRQRSVLNEEHSLRLGPRHGRFSRLLGTLARECCLEHRTAGDGH